LDEKAVAPLDIPLSVINNVEKNMNSNSTNSLLDLFDQAQVSFFYWN